MEYESKPNLAIIRILIMFHTKNITLKIDDPVSVHPGIGHELIQIHH